MANTPSSAFPLDIQHEARHRWLRPSQISQILRNYHNFHISPQPPHTPPSGSLFLFDRKVLRYFRKDGHNWRKKKDGKTVKEAHEKLKVGSVDVLHCYYAHGEENACFQRRSYWLLEEEFMHIVFVHYLEVKGSNRSTSRETHSVISNSQLSNSFSSSVPTSYNDAHAGNVGSPSAASTLTSTNEDIESEDNHQAMSKYPTPHSFYYPEYSFENNNMGALTIPKISSDFPDEYNLDHSGSGLNFISLAQRGSGNDGHNQFKTVDLASWEEVFEQCTTGSENLPSHLSIAGSFPINTNTSTDYNDSLSQLLDIGYGVNSGVEDFSTLYNSQRNNPSKLSTTEPQDNLNSSLSAKQPLIGTIKADEGLQKVDSFSKWMTKELDGVDDLDLKPSSNLSWQNIETTTAGDDPSSQLDNYSMSPSIGQDQLFDIHDFSPNCAYTDTETKVVITGKFLVSPPELSKHNWSCMFGQVEVPAEILGNDTLCCYAPLHSAGLVPFYVTCSNRFACSQVREFEYLEESPNTDHKPTCRSNLKDTQLFIRLEKLLSMKSSSLYDSFSYHFSKKPLVVDKILVLMEDEICWGVEQPLKQKLVSWLVDKVNEEDGKGPNVVDKEGQGLLHLAAALAFDWIIPPTLAAGVSVNFRDVNGWTALHWAACYGREKTVAFLIALGAAPGALTDPSPEFPLGRTPADLASANGYKGISGYLAESSLTAHLASLTMNDKNLDPSLEDSIVRAVQTVKDRVATSCDDGDGSDLSLRDSLAAVRNATQAAGRIHQVFRMQSFQRKQVRCCDGDDESLLGDQRVISLIASKIQKHRHFDEQSHSAAVHIQKKYRGYKKRKEFLIIRERVVKIQAHVRGHQVRKRYKTVVWSVGILEKVILRWRRKGTGLRGFRPESQNKMSDTEDKRSEEDDYDFLKEGRKQTEERLEKALVRVKSMVQYPEGRAQYRRLVSAVEDLKKNQQHLCSKILDSRPENVGVEGEEDMLDVESLLDDDNLMALTFE